MSNKSRSNRNVSHKGGGWKKGGFSKRFRCGRVILTKDDKVKKVDLENGGGSRYCKWYYKSMNFEDVRRQLIKIFNLNDSEEEIMLYDYELNPLDVSRYGTIFKYVNDNGLNCNGTILYLCTPKKEPIEKISSSSTVSKEHKHVVKDEFDFNSQKAYLEYPFKNISDDLVKNIRYSITQDTIDQILIELFQNCSILHGYICSTIHPAQRSQNFQVINQCEYLNNLDDIMNICKSMKTLMDLNKEKLHQIQNFSSIKNIFTQLYRNLTIWFDDVTSNSNDQSSRKDQIEKQSKDSDLIPLKKIKLEKQDDYNPKQMDVAIYSSI